MHFRLNHVVVLMTHRATDAHSFETLRTTHSPLYVLLNYYKLQSFRKNRVYLEVKTIFWVYPRK
jgi:hypothetical protein